MRVRRRGRGDAGASAVEFAIVVPVLLLFVLGMLEFSFVMRDHLSSSSAVLTGVRSASNGPGDGCVTGNGSTCVPSLAYAAANSLEKAGLGMPKNSIEYIMIYKANALGYPGAAGVTTMPARSACGTTVPNCVVFGWDQTANAGLGDLVYSSGVWNSSLINACLPVTDQVGVYIHVNHRYMSNMFGATMTINERAVTRFKPLLPNECASGAHA